MTRIREVPVEQLTPEAFRPFGQVLGLFDATPTYATDLLRSWSLDFDAEGRVELMFSHYARGQFEFELIERHFNVTQTFIPLGNSPSIMVVAAPTDRAAIPSPESIHAFYMPGSSGVMLWRGTWHATTRFPIRPSGADFAFLTDAETQRELERQQVDGTQLRLTQVVNMAEKYGVRFNIVDSGNLIGG